MEITTRRRWSGIVWCSDPDDPSAWLSSVWVELKILCVNGLWRCTCLHAGTYFSCMSVSYCLSLRKQLRFLAHASVFSMKACAMFACSFLKHVHSVHCLCCLHSTVFVYVCRPEQKLFSELAGVVRSVSVWLLPKAKEPSCRRRGSSCSPTTISG